MSQPTAPEDAHTSRAYAARFQNVSIARKGNDEPFRFIAIDLESPPEHGKVLPMYCSIEHARELAELILSRISEAELRNAERALRLGTTHSPNPESQYASPPDDF